MTTDLVLQQGDSPSELSVQSVRGQVAKIQELMKDVMLPGIHYGVIPGTSGKPSLLKPGAEKLCFIFRLAAEFDVTRDDLPNGHREYKTRCVLKNMATGQVVGEGIGSCSTMEKKYRYRYEGSGQYRKKVENEDIADVYNTVLKMSKKRAHIDATITTTAASDIFSQDIEEPAEEEPRNVKPRKAPDPEAPDPAALRSRLSTLMADPLLPKTGRDKIAEALAREAVAVEELLDLLDRAETAIDKARGKA